MSAQINYFTDTPPIINRTYEFSKAGDYDHLNYFEYKALERYGKDLFSFSKMMEASRIPPKKSVNIYYLATPYPNWRNKVNHWYELMFEVFGAYDNYIHAIWDPDYGAECSQKMDELIFLRSRCSTISRIFSIAIKLLKRIQSQQPQR